MKLCIGGVQLFVSDLQKLVCVFLSSCCHVYGSLIAAQSSVSTTAIDQPNTSPKLPCVADLGYDKTSEEGTRT